jgi:hypothetical protein
MAANSYDPLRSRLPGQGATLINHVVELVSKGSLETQESAARMLWHLAGNAEAGNAIAEAGGMSPLVSMLSQADVHAQVPCPHTLLSPSPNISYAPAIATTLVALTDTVTILVRCLQSHPPSPPVAWCAQELAAVVVSKLLTTNKATSLR